ncbi:MAG: leucyl/phenylalanyl-tRNA--protein transferase [Planctomycetota bacterium]|jgi:leucyl/phenylalanyl-tRNA--protein transferase
METDADRLTTSLLLWAYGRGWFPMADPETSGINWYSPDPRAIFPLDGFHVPRNLAREVRRGRFDVASDTAFESVMRACGSPRKEDDLSWIDERMISAYVGLHRVGHAHSIEAWSDGRLVGGLYGVHLGGAFFGESMFARPELGGSNASKVCLVHLVAWLRHRGFVLLDTQFTTDHLEQFGCVEIHRGHYLALLADAVDREVTWGEFAPS